MIFISAGHNTNGHRDPGAVANGYTEAELTVEFRDLVISELKKQNAKYIKDYDNERLGEYLKRIQTGSGSVVLEFHFDASNSEKSTGTTALVPENADDLDNAFAKELAETTARILNIRNRGVLSEKHSHRGRLGLMREQGIVALLELCFITNLEDMKAYKVNKTMLAKEIADILVKYEDLRK